MDLHRRPLALPLRLPVLRGDDGDGHRGVRGRLGVLRRRLPRPHPRQHQGDRRRRPIRSTPRITTAFLEYAQARGFHIDPARVRHARGQGARRAQPCRRPRRLLRAARSCTTLERRAARARPTGASTSTACGGTVDDAAAAARALRGRGAGRAAAGADRALRHPALERAEGRRAISSPRSPGALYSLPHACVGQRAARSRRQRSSCASTTHGAARSRRIRATAAGRPVHRPRPTIRRAKSLRAAQRRRRLRARRPRSTARSSATSPPRCSTGPLPWTACARSTRCSASRARYGAARVDARCTTALAADMVDVYRLARCSSSPSHRAPRRRRPA